MSTLRAVQELGGPASGRTRAVSRAVARGLAGARLAAGMRPVMPAAVPGDLTGATVPPAPDARDVPDRRRAL